METTKQHYMVKMKRGECHPIFSLDYLPENIASLIEAFVLSIEYLFVVFFLLNFLINVFEEYSMQFVPTIMINAVSSEFFGMYKLGSTADSNFIALCLTVILYVMTYKYFEFVKYNLHPRHVSTRKRQPVSALDQIAQAQPLALPQDFLLGRK